MHDPLEPTDPTDRLDLAPAARISRHQRAAQGRLGGDLTRITPAQDRPSTGRLASAPRPPATCECGGAGWYVEAVPFGHSSFGRLLPCRCTLERQAARLAEAQAALMVQLAGSLGQLADRTLEAFDPTWDADGANSLRQALAAATAYDALLATPMERGMQPWLYLSGPPGTGKSHLAAAIGLRAAARSMPGLYRSAPALLNALRAGYSAGDFDARLAAVCDTPLLILDDLGAEMPSANNQALLFEIIDERAMRPERVTIITSNLALSDLPDYRLASRIAGRAIVIEILANDYRIKRQARSLVS